MKHVCVAARRCRVPAVYPTALKNDIILCMTKINYKKTEPGLNAESKNRAGVRPPPIRTPRTAGIKNAWIEPKTYTKEPDTNNKLTTKRISRSQSESGLGARTQINSHAEEMKEKGKKTSHLYKFH